MESDLVQQLSAFSVSTTEEKLANRLTSTHLNSRPAQALFGGTTTTTTNNNNTVNNHTPQPMSTTEPSWMTKEDNTKQDDEGWGDLPNIHSGISQDYLFGFNSILSSTYAPEPKRAVAPNSAFARFQHAPVSFTNVPTSPVLEQNDSQ